MYAIRSYYVHENRMISLPDRLLLLVKTKQQPAFAEYVGLRRVEIFRLALADNPAAKATNSPADVGNGENNPISKAIISYNFV